MYYELFIKLTKDKKKKPLGTRLVHAVPLFKNIYSPNYFLNYFYSCVCHIYAGAYGGQMRTSDLRDLVSCESLDTDAEN